MSTDRPAKGGTARGPKKRKRGKTPGVNRTEWLADQLRLKIESGEWPPGYKFPTREEMEVTYDLSVTTIHNAINVLAWEGLVDAGQGKPPVVADPEPSHRLAYSMPVVGRLAELPISFDPDPSAMLERECQQRTVTVSKELAKQLELDVDDVVVERVIRLIADGTPILTSTSYVPAEAADDADGWQDTDVGRLALPGYAMTCRSAEDRCRMPTPTQRALLALPRGVPVRRVIRRYHVVAGARVLRAGVIVMARCDEVFAYTEIPPETD